MKNKYVLCFLTIILFFANLDSLVYINCLKNKAQLKSELTNQSEADDLIEYLASQNSNFRSLNSALLENSNNLEDNFELLNPSLVETSSTTLERGLGCEAMNKCS